jgi:hypothetical protein
MSSIATTACVTQADLENKLLAFASSNPWASFIPIKQFDNSPPLMRDWPTNGTTPGDNEAVKEMLRKFPGCNVGIAPRLSHTLILDFDGEEGLLTRALIELELEIDLGKTMTIRTPGGGIQMLFETPVHLQKNRIGDHFDLPPYAMVPGSIRMAAKYGYEPRAYELTNDLPRATVPQKLLDYLCARIKPQLVASNAPQELPGGVDWDHPRDFEVCLEWLRKLAPRCVQGEDGGGRLVKLIVPHLKDRAISEYAARELLLEYNETKCIPPWELSDDPTSGLYAKIHNGYEYCRDVQPGTKSEQLEPTLEDIFGVDPLDIKALRKADKQHAQDQKEREASKTVHGLRELCEQIVWVSQLKRFVRRSDCFLFDTQQLDAVHNHVTFGKSISRALFGTLFLPRYDRAEFHPGSPEVRPGQSAVYNTWRRSDVMPVAGDTSLWNEHLGYLFREERDRDLVTNWLAWVYQNQHTKPNQALLIVGCETGTGKTFISRLMEKLIGVNNTKRPKNSSLGGDFNGWIVQCKLCVIEELMLIGRTEVANELRNVITEPILEVNIKHIPAYQIPNVIAMMAISNHRDALPIDETDRRWLVVETLAKKREPEYYKQLFNELLYNKDALAAVAYELKHRDLKGYTPRGDAPRTAAKEYMIKTGRGDLVNWLYERLIDSNGNCIVDLAALDDIGVPSDTKHRNWRTTLQRFLRNECKGAPLERQVRVGGVKKRLWALNGRAKEFSGLNESDIADHYRADRAKLPLFEFDTVE